MKNRKRRIVFLTALLVILTLLAGCVKIEDPVKPESSSEEESEPERGEINPLTGEEGFPAEALGKRPVAVMVSNI